MALRFLRSGPVLCDLSVFLFQNFRTTFSVAVRFKCMRKLFLLLFLSSCLREMAGAKWRGKIAGAKWREQKGGKKREEKYSGEK